jgi:hypothetical protein
MHIGDEQNAALAVLEQNDSAWRKRRVEIGVWDEGTERPAAGVIAQNFTWKGQVEILVGHDPFLPVRVKQDSHRSAQAAAARLYQWTLQ